jgi:3-mercaptopyruvate sulfurtransferase SseA
MDWKRTYIGWLDMRPSKRYAGEREEERANGKKGKIKWKEMKAMHTGNCC